MLHQKGGIQISPDRDRALALVISLMVLGSGAGFWAYRAHRPPKPVPKPAAPVKPPVRSWALATIVVKPDSSVPVNATAEVHGALLPDYRIVAYYGNPKSKKMGILGQLPPEEMLPKLEATATEWAKVDRGRKVLPALHMVVTVAQGKPGKGGKYRLRQPDELIESVLRWAEDRRWIVFLDVQIGGSTLAEELDRLVKYLERPYVHLALDPEYAMQPGGIPGRRVGTLDAAQVNEAVDLLTSIVDRQNLPPKVLVVHRFTQGMITNYQQIKLDPRVQVVMNMDGFGSPRIKEDAYQSYIALEPVQFTGFKLFYKKDHPMMPPEDVLELTPKPVYIQYQ
jgi:hypothetical protein